MDCRGHFLGQMLASKLDPGGRKRLLDVAGGSGIYACAMAGLHPGVTACLFEKKPVDRIARTLIEERGYANRVSVTAGDMFVDSLPSGCDMHLWSNVLHDWDFPEVRELLRRSYAAMPGGGMIIIHDAFINEAKDGPYPVAAYSALLMCVTRGKCYAISEMRALLEEAGFANARYRDTAGDRGVMTAEKTA